MSNERARLSKAKAHLSENPLTLPYPKVNIMEFFKVMREQSVDMERGVSLYVRCDCPQFCSVIPDSIDKQVQVIISLRVYPF
jgi:hypothetical protein